MESLRAPKELSSVLVCKGIFVNMTDTPESALYFNAPGLKSQTIEVAPVIEPVKSKRKPLIEKEVTTLRTLYNCHYNSNIFCTG